MFPPSPKPRFGFQAKILIAVVSVMIMLTAVTVWLVNRRISDQLNAQITERLASARRSFRVSQEIRAKSLVLQYSILGQEPKFKSFASRFTEAAFQHHVETLLQSNGVHLSQAEAESKARLDHLKTAQEFLTNLLVQFGVKAAAVSFPGNPRVPFAFACADREVDAAEFQTRSRFVMQRAAEGGQPISDVIGANSRLLDVVSVPIIKDDQVACVLTLAQEIGVAEVREIKQMTGSDVVLLVGGQVAASSLVNSDFQSGVLAAQVRGTNSTSPTEPKKILLGGWHYFSVPGRIVSLGDDEGLNFVLASSYESAWSNWQETQRLLLLTGLCATLAGAVVVFFLIRRLTRPLRELRDSAEAVGLGDYSHRVQVTSNDECGELAMVFNRMTENVQASRGDLEKAVENLKNTQSQLIQSEKLSGIGEFVAGVAHELNNPLTSVMGFAELLQQSDLPEQQRRYLDVIFKSAKRCQRIVQSLLSFARRHAPERKVICLNEIIESAIEILQYQMRTSNIEVVTELDASLPLTEIDSHQMQQVFLNLINNARQAMDGQTRRGRLLIASSVKEGRVQIRFEDNGQGIPAENLNKIFNPFFTTKEVGKGTGLGLSLCYGIVSEHGGSINVASKEGEGASFVIEIPIASAPASITAKSAEPVAAKPSQEGVGKRVLVIDDEDAILQMIRAALIVNGYKVDVALDGETALKRLSQYHYDLALCDWKMPGLNGQDVYERLNAANPELSKRLIFITGDVVNEKTQAFLQSHDKVCLPKPFSLGDFRSAISRVILPVAGN